MQSQNGMTWLSLLALILAGTGCCTVQGLPGNCGPQGLGGLAQCQSCSGGCGETYVDEWVSEPPQVDACCAGSCRPVRSLLQALWGSRFLNGCDMCGGCDTGCDSSGACGYGSAGGSGCTTCGGHVGMATSSGGCNCGDGGGTVVAEPIAPQVQHLPGQRSQSMQVAGEPRLVPGSYKVSAPRRLNASLASEHINPAMQRFDARRATYSH